MTHPTHSTALQTALPTALKRLLQRLLQRLSPLSAAGLLRLHHRVAAAHILPGRALGLGRRLARAPRRHRLRRRHHHPHRRRDGRPRGQSYSQRLFLTALSNGSFQRPFLTAGLVVSPAGRPRLWGCRVLLLCAVLQTRREAALTALSNAMALPCSALVGR